MVERLVPDPFPKNWNWAYLWINSLKILYSLCLLYVQALDYQNISKLRCWPHAFTSYKTFLKHKNWSITNLPTVFCMNFGEKFFSHYILLTDQISLSDCLYFFVILGNMCITSQNLKLTLALLSNCFPTWPKESGQKFKYFKNKKNFLEDESRTLWNECCTNSMLNFFHLFWILVFSWCTLFRLHFFRISFFYMLLHVELC